MKKAQIRKPKYLIEASSSSSGVSIHQSDYQPSPLIGDSFSRISGKSSIKIPQKTPVVLNITRTPASKSTIRKAMSSASKSLKGASSTPRSLNTSTTPQPSTPAIPDTLVVIAIAQGRGHAKCEVGLASIDIKSPTITLSQFTDSATFVRTITKLNILNPVEVIFPSTLTDTSSQSELYKIVSDYCTSSTITSVQRRYFNETAGLQYLKRLSVVSLDDIQTSDKYYALSAVGALLKYIEFIQNTVFQPHSLPVHFTGAEKSTNIDATTARLLELVCNNEDIRSRKSLFGVLNRTKTSGGAKLLRSTILQPPCDTDTITLRYDCISEILNNEEMFNSLDSVLGRFVDIDTTLSLLVALPKQETVKTAERRISHIIYLKHLLGLVEPLRNALKPAKNSLFTTFYESLADDRFGEMQTSITKVIHEDTYYQRGALNMRNQKCFAVKPGINGMLDVARRTYSELVDDVTETISTLARRFNLPLKTGFTPSRGFYIQIPGSSQLGASLPENLPSTFVKVLRNRSSITCTTGDLIKLNDRITEILNDIFSMTNDIARVLLQGLYPFIGCMYKLSECTSTLDMIVSLANVSMISGYIRPEFTDTLALKSSRHPILDTMAPETIPNDVFASPRVNFTVITGPNMSGKSTYLKQVALLQIMAQVGCFLPAEYASLRIVSHVFSRMGCDDDIETNASTFTVEMREMKYILDHVTDDSLVLVDELGRGTSVDEGAALCYAISEHLLKISSATVLIATHFPVMEQLEGVYGNVVNYHFEVEYGGEGEGMGELEANPMGGRRELGSRDVRSRDVSPSGEVGETSERMVFHRKLCRGAVPRNHYGIKLAKLTALPRSLVEHAEIISKSLQDDEDRFRVSTSTNQMREISSLANYISHIVNNSDLSRKEIQAELRQLQTKVKDCIIKLGTDASRCEMDRVDDASPVTSSDQLQVSFNDQVRDRNPDELHDATITGSDVSFDTTHGSDSSRIEQPEVNDTSGISLNQSMDDSEPEPTVDSFFVNLSGSRSTSATSSTLPLKRLFGERSSFRAGESPSKRPHFTISKNFSLEMFKEPKIDD